MSIQSWAKALTALLFLITLSPLAVAEEQKAPAPELSYTAPVGARVYDLSKLQPYTAGWIQSIKNEETWEVVGTVEETLDFDEAGNWRHITNPKRDGSEVKVKVTRTLNRDNFTPLHFLRTMENGLEGAPVEVNFNIGPLVVSGYSLAADGTKTPYAKEFPVPTFDGSIIGLVIATMPLEEGYRETIPTSIPTLDASYWLEIKVSGKIPYEVVTGEVIEVWEVTANWYNIDVGDWYPPGRDDWGGAYYIAVEPGAGVPYVVEYAHSTLIYAWDGVRRLTK